MASSSADSSRSRSPPAARQDAKPRGILKSTKTSEETPLLSDTREQDARSRGRPEDDSQVHKSLWYILALTISIGGLQIAWSVELSNGSPYLLSLGMSKSLMALVWIAGPLSGTIVQPYVGMLSDNCRVSWGRRKPFMVGGAIATAISLMALSWTKEVVGGLLNIFGADPESYAVRTTILVVAVLWVYILDFAINTVQAAIRAFIVDCAPVHQQEQANSMASRIVGAGNIVGYLAGYVDLPRYAWWLGDSQFKILCAIASISLCGLVLLSVVTIHERDPNLDGPPPKGEPGAFAFFGSLSTSIKRLPPQVAKVCMVQFCAWIGFFPMLFYTSSYISEIYIEPFLEANPNLSSEELDVLYEKGTRVGTFALLIFAVTSLATNVLLPFFVAPTYDGPVTNTAPGEAPGAYPSDDDGKKTWLDYLVIPGFTLRRAWMLSNVIFAAAMFSAVFVRTVEAATALIGLVGITWALTLWAPWAIISAEISRRDALLRARQESQRTRARQVESTGEILDQERRLHNDEDVDKAGVILGIHNMAIASPQIIATIGSSVVFRIFQKPRGTPGDHSIGIVFAMGGVFVLASCIFIQRIKDEVPAEEVISAEEGQARPVRPGMLRRQSTAQAAMKRAALTRSTSFGTGLEY